MQSTAIPVPTFSDLLRSWRRTRKHSQWALSDMAGVSQRHLSFLESGRSAPSREMVLRLSQALELPLREQNGLLQAAGFAAVYPENPIDAESLAHARQALDILLTHQEPYPVIVVDRNWNLLLSNEANLRLFNAFTDINTLWEDIGGEAPNVARATLHPAGFRPHIRNWDAFAGYFLRQLGEELATNPFNRQARELLDEVANYPGMPASTDVPTGAAPLLSLELEKDGTPLRLFTMISTFGTPLDVTLQELRIETFFPADDVTDRFLHELAGH